MQDNWEIKDINELIENTQALVELAGNHKAFEKIRQCKKYFCCLSWLDLGIFLAQ